ncbi:ammonia-forming cytochrome c nitrite reductase subunit c552 [Adlercreutzia sp. ZJ473]|uniref:ammonia-forming cytochrome c nitrite reductase subunit c552 n=1 Tax=Adlercreutzia sp. ZJ473 TaxID=2722822 RepID=UPI00155239D1|nr:ammonia-forming cytochrome c nitrite reductase subunit c552 [Adlercreutzia sp. ZJ473]
MKIKSKKTVLAGTCVCAIMLVAGLVACAPQSNTTGSAESQIMPDQDSFGVVVADEWSGLYPNQYATYEANEANGPESGKHNYLELYPALNTMYKGYAFALGYDEASSHVYALQSVSNTPRTTQKEQLANCITCKTPQFTAQVNSEGDGVYAKKFNDLIGTFTEPISCYNCHENDPKELTVASKFFTEKSMGNDGAKVPMAAQVCGQCHNEYYFNPETKVTTNPYNGLAAMTPEAILAYYDGLGFKDWEHPLTGAKMLKVQHPEFETVYGGKQMHMAELGYSCADCHMGTSVAEDGTSFTNHTWTSPLENADLMKNTCSTCHEDLAGQVKAWQAEEEERVTAISEKIEDYINKLAAAKDTLSAEDLATAQNLHRTAQFYWDFVMVENSEGAHNPELTFATLDKAEAAVDQGLALVS